MLPEVSIMLPEGRRPFRYLPASRSFSTSVVVCESASSIRARWLASAAMGETLGISRNVFERVSWNTRSRFIRDPVKPIYPIHNFFTVFALAQPLFDP